MSMSVCGAVICSCSPQTRDNVHIHTAGRAVTPQTALRPASRQSPATLQNTPQEILNGDISPFHHFTKPRRRE